MQYPNRFKSQSLISFALIATLASFSRLSANAADPIRGSAQRDFPALSSADESSALQQVKRLAIANAELQCGSKVSQVSDFQVDQNRGQYGTYLRITASADFECITDAANQTLISSRPGLVQHVVVFRYKSSTTPAQRAEVARNFLALRDLSKKDGKPYILSIDTGAANSKEKADQNMNQGFIVTFKSVADRDYYVGQPHGGASYPASFDRAHDEFKKQLGASGYLDDAAPSPVFVFDFVAQ